MKPAEYRADMVMLLLERTDPALDIIVEEAAGSSRL
jgi:hypothetical protein